LQDASLDYVQFIDGDCELLPGWIGAASAFLDSHPHVAAVQGRLRERHPEATIYNRLCDMEWQKAVGEIPACGGIAMMRVDAFREAGGFDTRLIAGEEPELCVRLRKADWKVWSLPEEMALHDAAMIRFSQWWRRAIRGGHAFAQGAAMHGAPPERHKVKETRRALVWGLALPAVTLIGTVALSPWFALLMLLWPLNMARLILKGMPPLRAVFAVLARLPEAIGVLGYGIGQWSGRERRLIEYK
jgi:GT2 family glycosyltransferase